VGRRSSRGLCLGAGTGPAGPRRWSTSGRPIGTLHRLSCDRATVCRGDRPRQVADWPLAGSSRRSRPGRCPANRDRLTSSWSHSTLRGARERAGQAGTGGGSVERTVGTYRSSRHPPRGAGRYRL